MDYDIVIVGAGIAGLTSAAYLSGNGYRVLVCEKEDKVGGLVNSFTFNGFTFDGGIRAIENSGIVFPMLKQLGIPIDFVKNNVSIGIENQVLRLKSKDSLADYQQLLNDQFPESVEDIDKIIIEIKKVMKYMDVLYGIENPLFVDTLTDPKYLRETILPWLVKYMTTIGKIQKLSMPIDEYLVKFTQNQTLIDMIAQHFFTKTPAFFALSYFSLYLDYQYPIGGTGVITQKLAQYILDHGGEIRTRTQISRVNPQARITADEQGNEFHYKKLIWAADLKMLYKMIDADTISDRKARMKVAAQQKAVADKIGGDSIFTLYLTADMDKSYFESICSAHFFYTPLKKGLQNVRLSDLVINSAGPGKSVYTDDRQVITEWIRKYFAYTTYEIANPALRDAALAPDGRTGLIISTLMDYSIVKHISDCGWYDEFKTISEECMIDVLDASIFPGLKAAVTARFSSTPLTIEKLTGNSDGAITGWSFTNEFIPVVTSFPKVATSILTPIPDVFQAGQWSYSPSGLPISIMTGKLAADKADKQLKKGK